MVAFTSYGMFWISLVALLILPKMGIGTVTEPIALAAFLFMWGIFTFVMLMGTLRTNKVMIFVFASLTLLFVLLGLGDTLGNADITRIAGYEGTHLWRIRIVPRISRDTKRSVWQDRPSHIPEQSKSRKGPRERGHRGIGQLRTLSSVNRNKVTKWADRYPDRLALPAVPA